MAVTNNGGGTGNAAYMGGMTLEPISAEFPLVGALTYQGWKIRPVGSGFLLVDSNERIKGVCDSLEVAFMMLLGVFGVGASSDNYEVGAGIRLRSPQADTA